MEHDGYRLSDESNALLRRLGSARRRFWVGRADSAAILDELEQRGEPAAIPGLMAFLVGAKGGEAVRGAQVLRTLVGRVSNRDLAWLDRLVRSWAWQFEDTWERLRPGGVKRLARVGDDAWAVLAVCCSHPNGYVREEAVRLLREERSGRELRFLLLRANDWVKPVRVAAKQAVLDRVTSEHAPRFVACLDLVANLNRAGGGAHADLVHDITALISRDESVEALRAGLAAPERRTRRLAYRVALQSTLASEAIVLGLAGDDTLVRLICARRATELPLASVMAELRHDPSTALRQLGLRSLLANSPDRADTALREALLDRSGALRSLARYHLAQRGEFDMTAFYRAAISERRSLYAALCGLGETGDAADLPTFERHLDDETPRVRCAALRGLARLAANVPYGQLLTALDDRSPRVARTAAVLLLRHAGGLDRETLWDKWEHPAHAHSRKQALRLIGAGRKWDAGTLVLRATRSRQEDARALAMSALRRWLARYNHTFATPSPEDLERFTQAIDGARVSDATRSNLRHIAKSWTP